MLSRSLGAVPKFTVEDALAKLIAVGLKPPSKLEMGAKAEARLRKVLAINTNQSGGTMKFKDALDDLEEAHPVLQEEIQNAMKVYRANSSGMTKLYFRFLLGSPLEGGRKVGGSKGGGRKIEMEQGGVKKKGRNNGRNGGGGGMRVGLERTTFTQR